MLIYINKKKINNCLVLLKIKNNVIKLKKNIFKIKKILKVFKYSIFFSLLMKNDY